MKNTPNIEQDKTILFIDNKIEQLNPNSNDKNQRETNFPFSEIPDSEEDIFGLFADIHHVNQSESQIPRITKLEELLDLFSDPAIIFDPLSDKILAVNDKYSETYQKTHYKLQNELFAVFWQNPDKKKLFIENILDNGKVNSFETVHLYPEGAIKVSLDGLLIEYQEKQAIVVVSKNIHEEKPVGQSIIRAIQEWSDTVDVISDLIILEDSEGNLRRCNKATSDFFNLHYLELIGQSVSNLLQAEDDTQYFLDITDDFKSKREHLRESNWEGQLLGRDNWFEITNLPLPSINSEKTSWVHIIKDITEQRGAEAERQRLYTAIEQAADAILITDLDGIIQYVNSSFEQISGWTRDEVINLDISNIKVELDEDLNTDEIFSVILNGEIWQQSYKTTRRNGEVYDEQTTISLVRDAKGNPLNYVFACRDVTEAHRLESIAEAINMMDNVGYVFSGIRHELGNPINSIKTALTVLKQNLNNWKTEQVDVYIERCLTETTRVEYLLRTMKTFSMHENPQMQSISLKDYMTNLISLIKEDFQQRSIEVILTSEEEIGNAFFDPRALHQVMLNLLANAADSFENHFNAKIIIRLVRAKNIIYVTVTDNGSGISESQKHNLFKPFYTSKPSGTGLGLVIVKSMLGKMNGTISIESTKNIGTRVNFTLEADQKLI